MSEDTPHEDVERPAAGQHPSAEELRAYLDERLPGPDAQAVEGHLEDCDPCARRLDDVGSAPVRMPTVAIEAPAWDEARMRRSVRRTIVRTAANTALLLLLVVLTLQLVGWYVIHPLLVDRGDRLTDHVTATIDVPLMTVPGAELGQVSSEPGVLRRTTEVQLQRAVGARAVSLGTFTTRLGPRGTSVPGGSDIGPRGPWLDGAAVELGPVPFDAERLAAGTAATVELSWHEEGLDLDEASAVAEGTDDVTLLWVGFRIPGGEHPADPAWRLGYSACGRIPPFLGEQQRGGFGGAGDFRSWNVDSGARHALHELRRATANLAAIGWPDRHIAPVGALADLAVTADHLATARPAVTTVVITGSTPAIAAAIAEHVPDEASLLEVDFDRGPPAACA